MSKYDVVVMGDYFIDLVFTGLPKLPDLGEEVFSTDFIMLPGGPYNTVVALHRLGVTVGWAADFGNDIFSRFALEYAENEGIDTSLFIHHKQPMRHVTVAASFPQDRAFLSYNDREALIPAAIKKLPFISSRAVYLPGLYYGTWFTRGLSLLRAKNMVLIMDCNVDVILREKPEAAKAIRNADIFLPNEKEVLNMTEEENLEAGISSLAVLCPLVVVKAGSKGSYACQGSKLIHAPALAVTPLDTTGAGDCFNAGFIKAWLDGQSLASCLKWGNIVGGLSTLALGGTGQRITTQDVEKWLGK